MPNKLVGFCFESFHGTSDVITKVNGTTYNVIAYNAPSFTGWPYSVVLDDDGYQWLQISVPTTTTSISMTLTDASTDHSYSLTSVDFVGGRPPRWPH